MHRLVITWRIGYGSPWSGFRSNGRSVIRSFGIGIFRQIPRPGSIVIVVALTAILPLVIG